MLIKLYYHNINKYFFTTTCHNHLQMIKVTFISRKKASKGRLSDLHLMIYYLVLVFQNP